MKTKMDTMNLTLRQRIDMLEKVLDRKYHPPVHPKLLKNELDRIGQLLSEEKDDNEIKYVMDKIIQIYAKLSLEKSEKNGIEEIIIEIEKFDDAEKIIINSLTKVSTRVMDKILKQHDKKYLENITGLGFTDKEIRIGYSDKLPLIIELRCTGITGKADGRQCQKEFLEFLKTNTQY